MNSETQAVVQTEPLPVEEQINQELVKHNVTEAIITGLKEKYLPLVIKGQDDKETYLQVKDARKECKSLRVMAKKLCENGREEAVAIQKAWVAKEKEVIAKIKEVEDHLEKQEDEYEAEADRIKEERKRRIEEQFIHRNAELNKMGVLYTEGSYVLGEVSFEMSLVKECEPEIWEESILPKFKAEYEKAQAEELEKERIKKENEEKLKREQEQLEQQKKEMEEQQAEMKRQQEFLNEQKVEGRFHQLSRVRWEKDLVVSDLDGECVISRESLISYNNVQWHVVRDSHNAKVDAAIEKIKQAEEAERIRQEKTTARFRQLSELGLVFDFSDNHYKGFDCFVPTLDITGYDDEKWDAMIEKMVPHIENYKAEQEQKRLAEIEAQKEAERQKIIGESRYKMLIEVNVFPEGNARDNLLATMSENDFTDWFTRAKAEHEQKQREQWEKEQEEKRQKEEQRKAEELLQATEKEKWADIISQVNAIEVHDFKSGQYRKRATELRKLLDQIKAL